MQRLVVVEAHGTSEFVDGLRKAWDAGDAVLPLDPRLPPPARERLLAAARLDEPVDEGDALVIATSGTTGEPKAVVLTHAAVTAAAEATSARLEVDPTTDRWLACLPLAHVGGLGVVTRSLVTGTPLSLLDRPDPETVVAAAEEGCTLVSLVPTLLGRIDPALFRVVVLGGSAMPPELPANATATYGLTETGGGVVYDGRPLDGVELDLRPAAGLTGPEGEIRVRAPMLARTYRDGSPVADADGWFRTGDAGWWDPGSGRLKVVGRMGDMIVTGGENVWPTAVEKVLATHPQVAEVVVFGRDDPEWGQRVVARVVPRDAAPATRSDRSVDRSLELAQLRDFVKQTLPAWAAPRELELADSLPRTALGKLRRPSA